MSMQDSGRTQRPGDGQGHGFPRSHRLLGPADYRRVFSGAERVGGRFFTVLYRPNEGRGARLGMAISRKSLNRAVDRNRVKRLLRERFRHLRRGMPDIDIVFISRQGLASLDRRRLAEEIDRMFKRLRSGAGRSIRGRRS